MLAPMSVLRTLTRRPLRATVVALAVLVLVPAWVARSSLVFACPGMPEVRKVPCCPASQAKRAEEPAPEPLLKRACCTSDEVELAAARAPTTPQDTAAVAPPDGPVLRVDLAAGAGRAAPGRSVAPRATGPPLFLRKLALLR
jgi:hypothetical protein